MRSTWVSTVGWLVVLCTMGVSLMIAGCDGDAAQDDAETPQTRTPEPAPGVRAGDDEAAVQGGDDMELEAYDEASMPEGAGPVGTQPGGLPLEPAYPDQAEELEGGAEGAAGENDPAGAAAGQSGADAGESGALPRVDLAALRGLVEQSAQDDQILVLDFWATWCVPCVAMFEPLHDAMEQQGSRVRLVSVTLDAPGDTEEEAVAFLREHDAMDDAYLMTPDTDARFEVVDGLGETWYDLAVPAVLVFRNGQLAGEFLGSDAQVDAIAAKVNTLMQ